MSYKYFGLLKQLLYWATHTLILVLIIFRSSHRRCSVKEVFLEISQNSQEKYLCQSLFLNKVAGLRPAALLKKSFWHRCFPVNFAKFLRTPFFTEHLQWLLLNLSSTELAASESMEQVFYKNVILQLRSKSLKNTCKKSSFFSINWQTVKKQPPEMFYKKICS